MQNTIFDYLVIGAGAAGLQLTLAMLEDAYFRDKKIAIFDKSQKDQNHKTWCYWEDSAGTFDQLIDHSWDQGLFKTKDRQITLQLLPYKYKKLNSQALYKHVLKKIQESDRITWIQDEVKSAKPGDVVEVNGSDKKYSANHVFDSRIDPAFDQDKSCKKVWQHFKGWEIETENPVFNPEVFTMMDFRLKWKDTTSFTYVLPVSRTRALVEFTFFTPFFVAEDDYDTYLKDYIRHYIHAGEYSIQKIEKGVIPMSDYPFYRHHQKNITKIGTGGGWVRPSSGYSFSNSGRYVKQVIENIKSGRLAHERVTRNRFRTYDTLFLDLLQNHNEMGEALFTSMYSKNSIQQIFKFLDEETSLIDDVRLISTFEKWPFLKAAARQIGK